MSSADNYSLQFVKRLEDPFWRSICLCGFLILFATAGWAQRAAEVAGAVTDSTGSVVPGVTITATNTQTGIKYSVSTNDAGLYRLVELVIGPYQMEASKAGFKTQTTNVMLEAARTTTINMQLDVGDLATKVEVRAVAPTLDTQSQTVSNNVETKIIESVPVALRRPLQLLTLAAAVTYSGTEPTTTQTPFFSVAGGFTQPTAYFDGANATNTRAESNVLTMNPSIETTAEFRLVQVGYKAEYGGSGTGLVLATTKSGTNDYHGALWEFHRNKALDARNFFAAQKAPFREHIFGAAVGGPIKKNKLFFFANYEGTKNLISNLTGAGRGLTAEFFQTLPTQAQRQGDFSGRLNGDGSVRQIYDPFSTRMVSGQPVRDPFVGNIIPASRISPIAQKVLDHEPLGNRAPVDLTGTNNFSSTKAANSVNRKAVATRIDYDRSEKDKFFYRLMWDDAPWQYIGPWPGDPLGSKIRAVSGNVSQRNPFDPGDLVLPVWSRMHLGTWTHIFKPTLINDVHFAYNTRSWGAHHASSGLGLPSLIGIPIPTPVAKTTEKFGDPNDAMPNFNVGRYTMPGNGWLGSGDYQLPMRDWNLIESLTWVKSSHQFKMGYESRRSAGTMYTDLNWPGNFNFADRGTAKNPSDATSGDAFASFLLDFPDSGNYKSVALRHFWEWWHSFYFQDDWKVSKKLTLNIGVRYEFDTPMREGLGSGRCTVGTPYDFNKCQDRIIGFDFNAKNPVSNTPGVITFPHTYYDYDLDNFMPRIGFAYNVRGNTVVRGGFGTFYAYPLQWGLRGAPGDVRPDVATVGDFISPDNGLTAPYRMSTGMPAPAPFTPALLNPGFGAVPLGQRTFLNPFFIDRKLENPYTIQYDLTIQHQMTNGVFFEVGWIATLGRHIYGAINPEQIRIQDVQRIAATGRTPTALDRPYPQFSGLSYGTWPFSSTYNGLILKAEKRYNRGLSFLSNYTFSNWLDNTSFQDVYNLSASRGPDTGGNGMRKHHFVLAGTYELPLGPHRQYLTKGPLAQVLGGWNISPIVTVESGALLTPTASPNLCFCFGSQWANRVAGSSSEGKKTIDNWFNLDAFQHPGSNTFGNTGKGVIVGPGNWNVDTSIAKDVSFRERYTLSIRGEFFNFFNHTNFGNPSVGIPPRDPTTGQPLSTTNIIQSAREPRRIQVGLRFSF